MEDISEKGTFCVVISKGDHIISIALQATDLKISHGGIWETAGSRLILIGAGIRQASD